MGILIRWTQKEAFDCSMLIVSLRKTLAEESVQIRKDTLTTSFRGGLQWNGNEEVQDLLDVCPIRAC